MNYFSYPKLLQGTWSVSRIGWETYTIFTTILSITPGKISVLIHDTQDFFLHTSLGEGFGFHSW